jgi:hypothetical protein
MGKTVSGGQWNWVTDASSRVREWYSGFGGLEVACWPLVPKFAGLHQAEAVGFLG